MASRPHRTLSAILLSAAAAALALGLCAPGAYAADMETRSYPLPDNGTLQLTVPASWQQDIQKRPGGLPPTISFTPAGGEDFQVLITPITPPRPGMPMPELETIRADLEQSLPDVRPRAAERRIVIHSLSAPGVEGYYYSVTDKAPKPGEFRLMTQVEARAAGIIVTMTVLSNDTTGRVRAQALAVLKSAQHHASAQNIAITRVTAGYEVTVPVSDLTLALNEPDLDQDEGSGISHPRYFSFRDRAQGLIISGWFEPAANYPGLKAFWQQETGAWQKNKLPAPQNVAFTKAGGWEVIAYDIKLPVPNVTDTHLRAEWVQGGTWIDVHLEMTASLPADQARAKLEAVLKHLQVREKAK